MKTKKLKRLYGGDILIKKAGNENKWLITPGETFMVAQFAKSEDDFDYLLVYRPFQNHLKNLWYIITHIQIRVK